MNIYSYTYFSESVEENENVLIKNETIKHESPLYRAQSLKICEAEQTSQIFRPSDLIVGESLGEGFFGEVLKVIRNFSGCNFKLTTLK